MIDIKLNGTQYKNVSSITPIIEKTYYYQVTTLDGTYHQKVRHTKTNYTVLFFNIDLTQYNEIKALCESEEVISVSIPTAVGYETENYYAEIQKETIKGYLNSGEFYKTGLEVLLTKVSADE